ncbi:MAG: rhodanese-like domain-containing protein [Chloroflexota bacterium]|jgi:rhodanese-related sulfurtransferase
MKTKWLFLLLFALVLVACGGTDTAAPVAEQSPALGQLDLAPEVNVQTVAEVKDREDVYVLDVREQSEYDAGHIPGVVLLPLGQIPSRLGEIPTDKTVIVTCRTGNRSGQAVDFLRQNGFDNVHNMLGGIVAWEQAGYEVVR